MRSSSPSSAAIAAVIALTGLLLLSPPAAALMPCTRSLWDMMMLPAEDPFRVLEQSPLTVPRGIESPLALARADWKETPRAHVISLDVPGVKREDIKIEVEEKRVLRISGERRAAAAAEQEDERWHRAERPAGKFWRQFRLPASADTEAIEARLENGVLRVTVPKLAEEKKRHPRVVTIADAGSGRAEDIN